MPRALYDAIIAVIIAAVPLYLVELRYRWATLTDREPRVLAAAALCAVWLAVIYGSFIEPMMLVVRRQTVEIARAETPVRVALVSDTHLGAYRFEEWADRVVRTVNGLEPDLVLILGDIVSTERGTRMLAPFGKLGPRYGTFAVLGNWDYGAGAVEVRKAIESYGVEVLTNEAYPIDVDGRTLWVAGVDDVWFGRPDLDAALGEVPEDGTVLLATHNPDIAHEAEVRGVGLLVGAHTHGGQVRLPLIGPVAPLPTRLGRRFDRGLFELGPMRMFITSGAGESGPRARLLDPPEVVLLTVRF